MTRKLRDQVGKAVSVESTEGIHRGKLLGFERGEAVVKWKGGFTAKIDADDLLLPDGSRFDDYRTEPQP